MKKYRFVKNKKGISLIELIIYLGLLGLVLPLISSILFYGFDSYKSNYNMVRQENTVTNAIQVLRRDIEMASSVAVDATNKRLTLQFPNSSQKEWELNSNALRVGATNVVEDIDTSESCFKNLNGRLTLKIKPLETNTKKYKNRNMNSIITEFSVRYKQ